MPKPFLGPDFLLESETAKYLYHEHAAKQPIIDYHCHLPPDEIAANKQFENITRVWLNGDHYKWRAMRTNGVNEHFITGEASDREKFNKWAETVPWTLRNPLYHWTHLELSRYFGFNDVLNAESADKAWAQSSELLNSDEYRVQSLLTKMKVEVVGTTDDPADSLEHHKRIKDSGYSVKVLPTFRPDKAMAIENTQTFNAYINRLGASADVDITDFSAFEKALAIRHDYFHANGCRLSDHGIENAYAAPFTLHGMKRIFSKVRSGFDANPDEILEFKSGMMYLFAIADAEKGWTQQFHIGAIRNNNTRMMRTLGPDTGFDSIGQFSIAQPLAKFLDRLDSENKLAKTIIYNLNPSDNEVFATMIVNFNDGSVPGKVQFGSAWWFLDQKEGMERQMNSLSNMGLLPRFVGMLTDSRSFLSYPRHEYFRRILCNLLGKDVENGELPSDKAWLGKVVENICYHNAKSYFGFYSNL